ncbi:MAG: FAD-binding oxidoreductase [Gammaproteobacteria bacterium]|nr:FAD-binding oxidoreductase [Gammaproteobacteria bacterium]MBU1556840.1 FAD-binding oxidoreductase [Gammaproteobacteria bacterium]MBU2068848.1 FAD-binding oxidoreductase [Gammaproteobacteria bacterium]MBU2184989.1 FAD-binding oxidoreductase [Gammaproteobacteria bacterium]MBU2203715.1 FAD-binding oxidoreductase [Gammaproteobacteria bacterium]
MYDPLIDRAVPAAQPYPSSYWAASTTSTKPCNPLMADISTDVLVIGAGYTGLSCAIELAGELGREVTVLDANQSGWGCSGRNAGFVLRGTGRLGLAQLAKRYGTETAQQFHLEYGAALERVQQLITAADIDCQAQAPGYLKVAHKAALGRQLPQQAEYLQRQFGYQVEYVSQAELQQRYMHNTQAFGAIRFPDCFGVNPLALAQGYAKLAQQSGAVIYGATPVLSWQRSGQGFIVQTPQATVRCRQIILATNAYTGKGFYPQLNRASLPALSSVIVTQPLTAQQLAASGLNHTQLVMDTRALKYYYRKLPDNRLLFGGRSAVYGKDADKACYPERLLVALKQCFPQLQQLGMAYHWSGWVSVSFDDMPRICESEPGLFYAAGYCGSGLSFSSLAGKRLAQLASGVTLPALPIYQSGLTPFPLPQFRRLGQQAYYQWGRFKDRYL